MLGDSSSTQLAGMRKRQPVSLVVDTYSGSTVRGHVDSIAPASGQVFALLLMKLPNAPQPIGLALFAITATFAPAIGPTTGGYLTETYGWQYIFSSMSCLASPWSRCSG